MAPKRNHQQNQPQGTKLLVMCSLLLLGSLFFTSISLHPPKNMSAQHKALIETFYTAFQNHDAEKMAECYTDNPTFEDPAFGKLEGEDVKNMWRMLLERGSGELKVQFSEVEADENSGSAYWEAFYPFGKQKRMVHNKIKARFTFKDGKIQTHKDRFNFWKWSGMALGAPGYALGWTPLIKGKVRQTVRDSLKKFSEERAQQ